MNVFLGETEDNAGSKQLPCEISIAPQEAWIFEGSIRENILTGAEYDEKWYNEVTEAACLRVDFTIFPNGDETLVGYKDQDSLNRSSNRDLPNLTLNPRRTLIRALLFPEASEHVSV